MNIIFYKILIEIYRHRSLIVRCYHSTESQESFEDKISKYARDTGDCYFATISFQYFSSKFQRAEPPEIAFIKYLVYVC